MGGVKNELIEWEMDEPRREWILEQYGLEDDQIETDDWKEASIEYDLKIANENQFDFDDWYFSGKDPHFQCSTVHINFMYQIKNLLYLINTSSEQMMLKMAVSYAITLMESCLKDMLLIVTLATDKSKVDALTKIEGLKDLSVPLSKVLDMDVKAYTDEVITKHLHGRAVNYHNISAVISIFQVVVDNIATEPKSYLGSLNKIISIRNDLVHRDGKTPTGEMHILTLEQVVGYVENIEKFVTALFNWLEQEALLDEEDFSIVPIAPDEGI